VRHPIIENLNIESDYDWISCINEESHSHYLVEFKLDPSPALTKPDSSSWFILSTNKFLLEDYENEALADFNVNSKRLVSLISFLELFI
jgi:hypothetical protein